mmetsp:Transcript_22695/g.40431  ORF Transcript_22695/g.40431 Transcript_22695/m.40431 type:complete len:212 (+) Transcript_22695:372-1007(+)
MLVRQLFFGNPSADGGRVAGSRLVSSSTAVGEHGCASKQRGVSVALVGVCRSALYPSERQTLASIRNSRHRLHLLPAQPQPRPHTHADTVRGYVSVASGLGRLRGWCSLRVHPCVGATTTRPIHLLRSRRRRKVPSSKRAAKAQLLCGRAPDGLQQRSPAPLRRLRGDGRGAGVPHRRMSSGGGQLMGRHRSRHRPIFASVARLLDAVVVS